MRESDLVILNADVVTMNEAQPQAEAVASTNGRITHVGSNGDIQKTVDEHALVKDARGRTVLPGFIDCHVHLMSTATARLEVDLFGMGSLSEMLGAIRTEAARLRAGQWVRARSFDDSMVLERRYPNALELDEAAPNHPVILKRQDGHSCVLNTRALKMLQLPEDVDGFDLDPVTGQPNGILAATQTRWLGRKSTR